MTAEMVHHTHTDVRLINSILFLLSSETFQLHLNGYIIYHKFQWLFNFYIHNFFLLARMTTAFQSTSKPLAASTRSVTRAKDSALLTSHVRLPTQLPHRTDQHEHRVGYNSQMKQVERLFPEFFTHCSKTSFAESYKIKTCLNRKLDHRLDEPLTQSWLHLYGGGLHY